MAECGLLVSPVIRGWVKRGIPVFDGTPPKRREYEKRALMLCAKWKNPGKLSEAGLMHAAGSLVMRGHRLVGCLCAERRHIW